MSTRHKAAAPGVLRLTARLARVTWHSRSLERRLADAERSRDLYQQWYRSGVQIIAGLQVDLAAADRAAAVALARETAAVEETARVRRDAILPVLPTTGSGPYTGRIHVYEAAGTVATDPAAVPATMAVVVPLQQRGAA